MEKETTQVDEGLEAVIIKLKKQVSFLTKHGYSMKLIIPEATFINGHDAVKLIEFYDKHSKHENNG